jgi:hypothetical protein
MGRIFCLVSPFIYYMKDRGERQGAISTVYHNKQRNIQLFFFGPELLPSRGRDQLERVRRGR